MEEDKRTPTLLYHPTSIDAVAIGIKNSMEGLRSCSLGETEATSRPRILTHRFQVH